MPTYDSLVRDYHALAFKVARSVVRDDASAEDVVQDVYLRFLRDPAVLERAENLRAFVARAAVNAALDSKRGAGRREKHERASFERRAAMSPIEAAARAELRAKVGELPDGERLAVEMHYFCGLTKGETAAALQVPEGTVSSRLNAGLARLRQLLAGAAFAGLLAMLESELSKCAAEDSVPGNLGERLMRLSKGSAASPAPAVVSRKLATGVAATAAALFLALGTAKFVQSRAGAVESASSTAGAGGAVSSSPSRTTDAPANDMPTAATNPAPGDPAAREFVLEGFLFRRGDGFFVRDVDVWDHRPKQTVFQREVEEDRSLKESLTIRDAKGFPAVAPTTFGPFLDPEGDPGKAPRARVRLKVRAVPKPGPAPDEKDPFGSRSFGPVDAEIVEVLSSEILSTAWLLAWRDMNRASDDLETAWILQPGPEKRTRVLDAATRLGQAWETARASRRGERPADWRILHEAWASNRAADCLRSVGLEHILPAWPGTDELHAILMDAGSARGLRDAVVSRWGEEALLLKTWCYRGTSQEFHWNDVALADVLAMDEPTFAAFHRELDGIGENRPKPDEEEEQELAKARAEIASRGLAVAPLSSIDRERFIVDCGVRVERVDAGSSAERAGLRPGDILWKANVECETKGGREMADIPLDEWRLGTYLLRPGALAIHVLRTDGITDVELAR